jgi:hypothetical protein
MISGYLLSSEFLRAEQPVLLPIEKINDSPDCAVEIFIVHYKQ